MIKCWRCKKELICLGNYMESDIDGSELEEDEDAMITEFSCPYCGASYTVRDTPKSEMKNYKYFNKKK